MDIIRCSYCGNLYNQCPSCEETGVFKWRLKYCSISCFKKGIMEGDKIMRMQIDGKAYDVKSYDFKNGEFEVTNYKSTFKIKEEDELIQAYFITPKEYKELKYGKYTKSKGEISTKTKEEEK